MERIFIIIFLNQLMNLSKIHNTFGTLLEFKKKSICHKIKKKITKNLLYKKHTNIYYNYRKLNILIY